jgi:hypothetical protein
MDVTLVQAWGDWAAGKPIAHAHLWGLNVLWWGRIGKLGELTAGLTIVADIVGPKRIRSFGHSLHHRFDARSAVRSLLTTFRWLAAMGKYAAAKRGSAEEEQALGRAVDEFTAATFVNFAVGAVLSVGLVAVLRGWSVGLVQAVPLYFVVVVTVSPVVTALLIFGVIALGLVVDTLVFEPLAWVLDRDAVERWIKVTSVLLLVAGFHFDLLAS